MFYASLNCENHDIQMVNISPRHVFQPHPHVMVAFTGLEGDIQSLKQDLQIQVESKTRTTLASSWKKRNISPRAMSSLTSHLLYGRRQAPFYVEPLVVGLETVIREEKMVCVPYLCAQDVIGAQSISRAFVCAGVASNSLYGTAEAAWRPGLSPDELAHVCGNAFLTALERDSLSGYGAMLYLLDENGVVEMELDCRND